MRGITTFAEPKKAVYLCENGTDKKITVGIYDDALPGRENKMRACRDAFASAGQAILDRLSECEDEWVTIDEIGYLEADIPEYCDAIGRLFARKHVAAVVRAQSLPFLSSLCSRDDVFLVDLDDPFGNTACVIMASGMGVRFGGNKLMADFRGAPMIVRALDATEGIFSQRVVVTRHADVAALCSSRGISYILHDQPHRNDTVRLGIEAAGNTDRCVFCPADQPLLQRETVAALVLAAKNCPDHIWRVSFAQTPGAPVLFPHMLYEELAALPEGKGGGVLAKKYPDLVHTVEAQNRYELMDADTREALTVLESLQTNS